MLRVEHEAVVLIELGEAEARLIVRVDQCRLTLLFARAIIDGFDTA